MTGTSEQLPVNSHIQTEPEPEIKIGTGHVDKTSLHVSRCDVHKRIIRRTTTRKYASLDRHVQYRDTSTKYQLPI
jgi:hypothetical protein